MAIISSKQIEDVLKNEDNAKILNKAGKKYRNAFNSDEFANIKRMAAWKCLQKHIDGAGQKFTSSLYQHMVWQCLQGISYNAKNVEPVETKNVARIKLFAKNSEQNNDNELDDEELQLAADVFLYNKSVCKISRENKQPRRVIEEKITKLKEKVL